MGRRPRPRPERPGGCVRPPRRRGEDGGGSGRGPPRGGRGRGAARHQPGRRRGGAAARLRRPGPPDPATTPPAAGARPGDVASAATTPDGVVAVLADACQDRRTSAARLATALDAHPRLRQRRLLEEVLADVAVGALSPLERRYLRDVERAHGLPGQEGSGARPRAGRSPTATSATTGGAWSSSSTGAWPTTPPPGGRRTWAETCAPRPPEASPSGSAGRRCSIPAPRPVRSRWSSLGGAGADACARVHAASSTPIAGGSQSPGDGDPPIITPACRPRRSRTPVPAPGRAAPARCRA